MLKKCKKAVTLLLVLTLSFGLVGCSTKTTEDEQVESSITLTDQADRTVVLEAPAQKIVSAYYISTYTTLALSISDKVVGLENKADTRAIYHTVDPSLIEKPGVGTSKAIDVEAIAALNPDLVIIPLKLQDYVASFDELGIPVLVVNPESQELLEEMITLIATATGSKGKADELLSYYDEQTKMLSSLKRDSMPSVYMASNSSYLEAATTKMYQNSIIELAGGKNAIGDIDGDYWTSVSYETILAKNPEVIVVPAGASYSVEDVLNDAQLQTVSAVVNKQVYQMPKDLEEWDSPVPSGILGSMWLASILHSDQYSHETFVKDVQSFYKEFYGFDVDTSLLEK